MAQGLAAQIWIQTLGLRSFRLSDFISICTTVGYMLKLFSTT